MAAAKHTGRLHGKTCMITGPSSGLGKSIAFAYASEGAQLFLVDLYPSPRNPVDPVTGKADSIHNRITGSSASPNTLDALQATFGEARPDGQPGPRFVFHKADITVAEEAEGAVAACVAAFGRLDVLCCNAGVSVESRHERVLRCHETSEADFDCTMAANAKGVFLGCKYALRQMVEGQEVVDWEGKGVENMQRWDRGWIVNTASIQGLVGYAGTPSYCASKGAVVQLTKQIALDYGPDRIHCNAICPGFLRTAMTQNLQSQPEVLQGISDAHPFGGMGDPEDVARAAVFLASRDAAWITGHPLVVDGGYTAQ